jgi:hypothetical protein
MSSLPNVRAAHQSHAEPATITTLAAAQARFTERYREFKSRIRHDFADCTPEKRDDCTARALAFAWQAIVGELRKGQLTDRRMKSCVGYACKKVRGGRRDYRGDGRAPRDLTLHWRKVPYSDDRRRAPSGSAAKIDVLVSALTEFASPASPIPDIVAFRLDTPRWLDSLTPEMRERAIDLGMGWKTHECAKRWNVSRPRVSQIRTYLANSHSAFVSH